MTEPPTPQPEPQPRIVDGRMFVCQKCRDNGDWNPLACVEHHDDGA